MKNIIAVKPRFASIAARGVLIACCVSAAPAALANTDSTSAPEGAGYLLSYGSHNHQMGYAGGNQVGTFGAEAKVPEPATWGIFGLGLAMIGLGAAARRRRVQNGL